ncbi:unnamed protein product [Caenorhabditis angaria]|uniref:Uncharacterized protein n=1 Tax=Caenorhabditis angaria TaxID=860376 RepID=A0A9P1IMZ2_9PELO|nr:unnamed protein product [Caenorhabditis angaria]
MSFERQFFQLNSRIFGTSGIVGNLFSLFLIFSIKNSETNNFRSLLILYCCVDISYCIFHIWAQPGFAIVDNVYIYFSYSITEQTVFGKVLLAIFAFLFIESITVLMTLFAVRFNSIKNIQSKSPQTSIFLKIFIVLSILIFPSLYCLAIFVLWEKKGVTDEQMNEIAQKLLETEHIVAFAVRTNSTDPTVIQSRKTFSLAMLVILFEISAIIFCGAYVSLSLRKISASDKTRKLQKQILIYHVTQTACVFFCCGFHVTLFSITSSSGKSTDIIGTISSAALVWFPTFDFVILCSCLSSYRNAIKRIYYALIGTGPIGTSGTVSQMQTNNHSIVTKM